MKLSKVIKHFHHSLPPLAKGQAKNLERRQSAAAIRGGAEADASLQDPAHCDARRTSAEPNPPHPRLTGWSGEGWPSLLICIVTAAPRGYRVWGGGWEKKLLDDLLGVMGAGKQNERSQFVLNK